MDDSNDHSDPDDPQGVGRRGVLGALGLGAGASLLGAGQWLASQAAPATRLTALLSGANQVPPLSSSGTGTATFTENDDGTLDFRVTVVDLEGITQAHIHEGGADENGPVVADLFLFTENIDGAGEGFARNATAEDPVVESGTVEDTELVSSILETPENYYVNVHTVANPAGEIRGQLTAAADAVTFSVRIENVSTEETLMPAEGDPQAVPLSPGAFAVYPTVESPEPAVTETPAMGNATEMPGDETATETEVEATETEAVIEPMADHEGTETETPGVVTGRPEDGTETPGMATETPGMATETPEETPTPEATPTPVPTPTVTPASPTVANPIFTPGEFERGNGLEQIAEDGDPSALGQSLGASPNVAQSGVFDTPVDAESPSPIGPGGAYEFAVTVTPDQRLTFATMFIPSNDLFFAPGAEGISLFDGGEPLDGDVTDQVALWDAGTEANEPPGTGPNQAPRQEFPDQGTAESNRIRLVDAVPDGYTYPATSEVVSVTISPITAEAATETPAEEEEEEEPGTEMPGEEEEEEEPATETPAEEEPGTEMPGEETETPESGGGGSGDDGY